MLLWLKGSSNKLKIARGSMHKESTIQELSRSHDLPLDWEDIFSIPMEEVARTITMAPRMVMGMEEATARPVPTNQPQPRGIWAKSLATSVRRLDIMSRPICDPILKEREGPTKDRSAYWRCFCKVDIITSNHYIIVGDTNKRHTMPHEYNIIIHNSNIRLRMNHK